MTESAKGKNILSAFFMGKLYPLVFAILVTVGHLTEQEFYFNFACLFLAALALCTCRSIRPMLITIPAFIFQVSEVHSPANPVFSDYYFTEWRLPALCVLGGVAVIAIAVFIIRNRLYKRLSIKKTRLLLPSLLLAVAFLANGLGSDSWSPEGLAFGAGQILVYLFLFFLFYLGFSEEDTEESLVDYFCYITLVIAYMIIVQMAELFILGDALSETGAIIKNNINLGWATCNPLGVILVSLLPVLFYGAMKKRGGWFYFLTAVIVYVAAVSTCSRNALLFGSLMLASCMLIACCKSRGKRRVAFIIASAVGALTVALVAIVLREKLLVLFESFVTQGADNNGRFALWGQAWKLFEENRIFGSGFFSLNNSYVYESIAIMPTAAHNTVLELLYATGVFGFAAYMYYRIETIRVFVNKPSLVKTMLGLTLLTLLLESLLDVFVFCFYPMFYPMAALAVAFRINDLDESRVKTDLLFSSI